MSNQSFTQSLIEPKADLRTLVSPEKRKKDFFFFAFFLLFRFSHQKNQIRLFVFWENLRGANPALGFI